MRTLWARLCAALMTLAVIMMITVTNPAAATTVTSTGTITGQIEQTWQRFGGAAVLGDPVGLEHKTRSVQGVNVYTQATTGDWTVHWDRSQGGKAWPADKAPSLAGVSNERVPLGLPGLWRSGKLCGSSASADRLLVSHLWDRGLIIDLRTSGTIANCSDPLLPGVSRVNYPVPSSYASDYRKYVTSPTARQSFGRSLQAIAGAPGNVLIHCTAGKDRTGWLIVVLMSILGREPIDIQREYLRSPDVTVDDLTDGLDQVATSYGARDADAAMDPDQRWVGDVTSSGMYWYVREGLGLSQSTIEALRAKFA